MKALVIEIVGDEIRAFVAQVTKNKISFKEPVNDVSPFRNLPSFISLHYPNPIIEEVEVPPVDDPETVEILIKKRLRELGVNSEVIFAYSKSSRSEVEGNLYNVHAVPKELFLKITKLVDEENIKFISVSEICLAGVSIALMQDKTVLHLFADEDRVITSVSRGNEVIYTRVQDVPAYVKEQELGIERFLEENFTLTYSFVSQRQGVDVDTVLLSGRAKNIELEVENGASACPIPYGKFAALDMETFHRYTPSLGILFLPDKYDFSPLDLKELKWFERLRSSTSKVLLSLLFVLVLILSYFGYGINKKIGVINSLKSDILRETQLLLSGTFKSPRELEYYANYARLIESSINKNPVGFLYNLKELEYFLPYINNLSATKDNGRLALELNISANFSSASEMGVFLKNTKDILEEIRKKGFTYSILSEDKDFDKKEINISIKIEEGGIT